MNERSMDLAAPQIDSVEIIELLGKGGMSLVYKARQKQLDRIVAVKVLSGIGGEDGIKRFQKEAKLTSTLDHPNIVKTISFGVSKEGQPYLVMEYLEGLSLGEDLKQNGRLKLQKFKDVFLPALSALGQAHQSGLIHRDIKPGNIMICRNETGGETVKLVDFGIAKVFGEGETETQNLTKSGALIGSPAYMSPEQCQGKPLDGRSDLYSMACVMYETLSGEPPFSGESILEVMHKHSIEPPPTVSDLSRKIDIRKELAKVTLWGLAKDPAARPQTASEFARKLNEVLERITLDKVPRLKKSTATARTLAWQPLTIAFMLVSATFLFCGVVFMLTHNQPPVHDPGESAEALKAFKAASSGKAEREYKRMVGRAEKAYGTSGYEILPSLQKLGTCYGKQGKYAEAELVWKRALAIREKALGQHNPYVADYLSYVGNCCLQQGKYLEAELLFKRALSIREERTDDPIAALSDLARVERTDGNDPLHDPIVALFDLANCYFQQGKFVDAEPLYKRGLAICEKMLDANDPLVADVLTGLAGCYRAQGKSAEAEGLERRASAIRSRAIQ